MEVMFDHALESEFELRSLAKIDPPPARALLRPEWECVFTAIQKVYLYGGFIHLRLLKPESAYLYELDMIALPGQFRLLALTRDENPRDELLEWWDPFEDPFRGVIRFGDDDWDARTVSTDINIAEKVFYQLHSEGQLTTEEMRNFRSQWNPKP